MTKIILDTNTLQTIALFERLTRAHVKDCIISDNQILFIVNEGEVGKAVGKGGQNIRQLEQKLKKKAKVAEFNPDVIEFVKNVISPLQVKEARLEDTIVFLSAKDLKTRGLLIGRGASNLRAFEAIVKRYFPITEIKVE